MRLEVSFARASFCLAEDIALHVRLVNDGPAPVTVPDPFHATNWQPVYHLWRDGESQARRVTFRGAQFDDHRDPPEGVDPALVTLAPGEAREDDVPLRDWAHLDQPGRYHLVATLTWEGVAAQSPEAVMEISPPSLASLSIGINVGVAAVVDPWLSWIQRGPGGSSLGQSIFHEERPDLGEIERRSGDVIHAVRDSAHAAYAPWTTYDRVEELGFWRAWRDGHHLAALDASQLNPLWHDLGEGGAVIHPVVMSRGGALTACVRSPEGSLRAVRFTLDGVAEHVGPTLPAPLVAARVAPDPSDDGESFVVVALCEGASGGLRGLVARFDPAAGWRSASFSRDDLAATPRCGVGATVIEGRARGGFFALTRDDGRLLRVEVDHLGEVAVVDDLGRADDPPWASAVSFGLSPGAASEAHWVLMLSPTRAMSSRGATPSELPARPLMPLEPLAISQSLYLPTHDARDGVAFYMLR